MGGRCDHGKPTSGRAGAAKLAPAAFALFFTSSCGPSVGSLPPEPPREVEGTPRRSEPPRDPQPKTAAAPAEERPPARPDSCAPYANDSPLAVERGLASYYADSLAGRPTASGVPYDPKSFLAAHRKLPFGTIVRVRRVGSGKQTCVVVRDRGPFGNRKRIIDLSRAAAEELDLIRAGVAEVVVEVLVEPPAKKPRPQGGR